MKVLKIIVLLHLVLISCNKIEEKTKETKTKIKSEISNTENTSELIKSEEDKAETLNFSKTIKPFIGKILNENQRKHEYAINNKKIQHLDLFGKNGLEKIVAFSDKRYPKSMEPSYYEHFVLFAFLYDKTQNAKNSYNEIKEIFTLGSVEYKNLSEEKKQRIQKFESSIKPGGLICQKGKYIFSLVKTCRDTPIGGKWKAYEDLFLSFILESNEEIRILNADCGQMKYNEEKRKT